MEYTKIFENSTWLVEMPRAYIAYLTIGDTSPIVFTATFERLHSLLGEFNVDEDCNIPLGCWALAFHRKSLRFYETEYSIIQRSDYFYVMQSLDPKSCDVPLWLNEVWYIFTYCDYLPPDLRTEMIKMLRG